jgi:hypothetical protein
MSYGAANSADDRLSRLAGVALTGGTDLLGEFTWLGAGRWGGARHEAVRHRPQLQTRRG